MNRPRTTHGSPRLGTIVAKWLAGEAVPVRTRRGLIASVVVAVVPLAYACTVACSMTASLRHAGRPPALPRDEGDTRFGVPLDVRKAVFHELAEAEPGARAIGKNSFPTDDLAWSAEDHRGAYERQKVAAIILEHGLTMTQVYLILDEGIRQKWPGPDGQPLTPFTVPLHPRRKYGW